MGKRRSMLRKKKYDEACSRVTINGGVAPWSDLPHDVLFLVMMKLGVVNFLAFSRVCKSWRSLAVCNRNKFIVSRPPMSICTKKKKKECYLEDFEGRKFKITLPRFSFRKWLCVGVTGGYLILFNESSWECWLVNLITRHQLHFPGAPVCCPRFFRAILVFSPSLSEQVFVLLKICHQEIWFCIAGKREWTKVSTRFGISDLHAFKGKIYTIVYSDDRSDDVRLCEMKLYPKPKLVLLKTKNFTTPDFRFPKFVNSGENLYVIDADAKHPFKIHELDFGEMKWVSREKTGEKYAFFRNTYVDVNPITLRERWDDIHSQYGRYAVNDKKEKDGFFNAKMWYFLDDCLNVNLIHNYMSND